MKLLFIVMWLALVTGSIVRACMGDLVDATFLVLFAFIVSQLWKTMKRTSKLPTHNPEIKG